MKKFILMLCAICMCGAFALTACDDSETPPANPPVTPPATEYTVTYADGLPDVEIAVPTDSAKYTAGATVTVKAGISTDGYTFQGWNDGTTTYQPDQTFPMPAHNVTLTAQWQPVEQLPSLFGVWQASAQIDEDTVAVTYLVIAERDGTIYYVAYANLSEGLSGSSGIVRATQEGYEMVYYTLGVQEVVQTATLTAEGLMVVADMDEGQQSVLYPVADKTELPENAQFPAKLYNAEKGVVLDFTAKRLTAKNPAIDEAVEFVYLGDFVLVGRQDGGNTVYSTLYKDKDQNKYYIWDSQWWQAQPWWPDGKLELTETESAPQDSLVGVWTGTAGESSTSLYIAESGGKLYFVMIDQTHETYTYSGGVVTEKEGAYRFSLGLYPPEFSEHPESSEPTELFFTLAWEGEALTGNFMGAMQFERAQDQTLSPFQMSGRYSGSYSFNPDKPDEGYTATIDFTGKTWNGEEAEFVAVGDFILIASRTVQDYLVVFKAEVEVDEGVKADKYYFASFTHLAGYFAELTPQA